MRRNCGRLNIKIIDAVHTPCCKHVDNLSLELARDAEPTLLPG
jgi:hypothetical protein